MTTDLTSPDPARFDLKSFADLLPNRPPIAGEDPGSYEGFHEGMMQSLLPMTPYEGVIAENLIAIEWELLQHRRMRDASLRETIRDEIHSAVVKINRVAFDRELDALWKAHVEAGGTQFTWNEPEFDIAAAREKAHSVAEQCRYADAAGMMKVCDVIKDLGMDPLELMGEAYRNGKSLVAHHEEKLPELERRRRDVKRDYDALQSARPLEAEVIEG